MFVTIDGVSQTYHNLGGNLAINASTRASDPSIFLAADFTFLSFSARAALTGSGGTALGEGECLVGSHHQLVASLWALAASALSFFSLVCSSLFFSWAEGPCTRSYSDLEKFTEEFQFFWRYFLCSQASKTEHLLPIMARLLRSSLILALTSLCLKVRSRCSVLLISAGTQRPKKQWGWPRTWSSADLSLYLTKQKGSASALPDTSRNLVTSPNPWKYSRRASLEASSGKSLKASSRVFTFFPGSAIWMYESLLRSVIKLCKLGRLDKFIGFTFTKAKFTWCLHSFFTLAFPLTNEER